jgi:hypothetical protein
MTEATGLLLLVVGLGALGTTGALAACCLHLRSPVTFVLASYVLAWFWLVALTLVLSPARWLTRETLVAGLGLGFAVVLLVWVRAGRPRPPELQGALVDAREALRDPAVAVLAAAVSLGVLYLGALAFYTPSNEMDALEYHLARASLWRQNEGLGHIEHVDDARVNLFPPNAEIGQLATMLLSGRDRYTALPQLLAYAALIMSVGALARRAGLGTREAVFGALAFATLPVVLVQAPSSMNDLVVGSFLSAGAVFGLGAGLVSTALLAVAVALAVGTKYTALIGLPTLAVVLAVAHPPRRWLRLLAAVVAGCAVGSVWFVVNLVETGGLGTDVPNQPNQRANLDLAPLTVMVMRLALSFVDMSGAPGPYALVFLLLAVVLAGAGLLARRRSRPTGALFAAAGLTGAVLAIPLLWDVAVRVPFKIALWLGGSDLVRAFGWVMNTKAEPLVAGYGPLALMLLLFSGAAALLAWRRGRLPALGVALAAAPVLLLLTLAAALSYDTTRARFLLFGIALATATWGLALRVRAIAFAATAIGSAALFLALSNYHGKPSGLFTESSIWAMPRWQAQTTRNGFGSEVLAFVESDVPRDARVALALIGDDWIHPFFGPELTRQIEFVAPRGGTPPDDAEWLVLGPGATVVRCLGSWSREFENLAGWRVERRLAPDDCAASEG